VLVAVHAAHLGVVMGRGHDRRMTGR